MYAKTCISLNMLADRRMCMHFDVSACISIRMHMHIPAYRCLLQMHAYQCICMHMYENRWAYPCIYICIHICIYIYMYVYITYQCIPMHTDAYRCICMHTDAYRCIPMHMRTDAHRCTCIHTYRCIPMHMHAYRFRCVSMHTDS